MSNTPETLFDELEIRPVTKRMAISLMFDLPLTPAEIVDYGLDTPSHFQAVKAIILGTSSSAEESFDDAIAYQTLCERVEALDKAYGNGQMLNALVRKYAPEYTGKVHFHTSWDDIFGRSNEEKG